MLSISMILRGGLDYYPGATTILATMLVAAAIVAATVALVWRSRRGQQLRLVL